MTRFIEWCAIVAGVVAILLLAGLAMCHGAAMRPLGRLLEALQS